MAQTRPFHFYKGAYTVELQPGAHIAHLPPGAVVTGNTVRVGLGTVQQVMGGIQFYANGRPVSWGYIFLRCIRDAKGEILWQNWNVKD